MNERRRRKKTLGRSRMDTPGRPDRGRWTIVYGQTRTIKKNLKKESNPAGLQGPLRLWNAAKTSKCNFFQLKKLIQNEAKILNQNSVFFLPQAMQNSSPSFSFHNLNITGDYRHLSFIFLSKSSLPRLIQVVLFYSSSTWAVRPTHRLKVCMWHLLIGWMFNKLASLARWSVRSLPG